ncbi:hypothetical protein ADK70_12575 [Streptomyces rimosus subsp. pseudoverticillatus]|uniref:hypothetical protein n=1 Tax=Streptomyces rimosus TaxID=1927 RepID=UPI0006B2A399|nr:hypothetical protein [Streptomyces rimosus]KOT94504.1 hypothetical protein ADK70_12575 [Streptomyces rimosus subsp. pseudoverticillatus]
MTMRPAAWVALALTVALLVACPQLLPAAFAAVDWLLNTPLAAGAALAFTLVWIAMRPEYGRRWAR